MVRVLLLLVMALSQAQPLAAGLLCEQHQAAVAGPCMGDPSEHHSNTAATDDNPASRDCAAMLSCSMVASAYLTPTEDDDIVSAEFRVAHGAPTARPAATLHAPPFHPPRT